MALTLELDSYKQQVKTLKFTLESINTKAISDSETVRSLREKNAALERKQSKIEKLSAKNQEIKIRQQKKEEEKSAFDATSNLSKSVFSDKIQEHN